MPGKLARFLLAMGGATRNRFDKFLRSPYHNERGELVELFRALRENPLLADDRAQLWAFLFSEKKFDDARCRKLLSDLCALVLHFWALEKQSEKPGELVLATAHRQFELGLADEAEKSLAGLIGKLRETAADDADHALLVFRAEQLLADGRSEARKNTFPNDGRSEMLHFFYLVQSFQLLAEQFNYAHVVRPMEPTVPSPVQKALLEPSDIPLLEAWRLAVLSLSAADPDPHGNALIELLRHHSDDFAREDLFRLYTIAQNFCIRRLNAGEIRFRETLLELYERRTNDGLLTLRGVLPHGEFKNMVTLALHLKAFERAERFIRELSGLLPPEIRDNAFSYNLAKLHFERGDFEKVIEGLRDVVYEDVFYAVGSRWMLLRTYYELGEFLAFDALLDSFRHFLRRTKSLSGVHRKEYLHALRFIHKLSTLDHRDSARRAALREAVEKAPVLYGKRWFLEQLS
jgi:hypothetical protein